MLCCFNFNFQFKRVAVDKLNCHLSTAATPLTASTLSSSSLLTRGAAVVRTRVAEQVTLRDDRIRCCATLLSSSSSALRAKTRRVVRRRRAAPMRRTACTTSSAASQSHGCRHCCRRYSRRRAPSSHTRRRSCCARAWSSTPAVHTSSPLAPARARRRCDRTDNRTARDSLRTGPRRVLAVLPRARVRLCVARHAAARTPACTICCCSREQEH